MNIDYSVYPDMERPPESLDTAEDRADYVARICGAWDFGIVPKESAFVLFSNWREVFDRFPLDHSLAYHAFRAWYRWPAVRANILLGAQDEDSKQGRTDPCERMI